MKKYIILSLLFFTAVGSTYAQSSYSPSLRQVYSVNWNINIPSGGYTDFISSTSLSGINFSALFFLNPKLAFGGDFGWNYYDQAVDRKTYYIDDNTAITGSQFRYAQSFPIKFVSQYYLNPSSSHVKAFAGLGLGAIATTSHIVIQDRDFWDQHWGFLISPEIGVLVPFGAGSSYGLRLSAGYNYSTNGTHFANTDISSQQGFYFNVGLFFGVY